MLILKSNGTPHQANKIVSRNSDVVTIGHIVKADNSQSPDTDNFNTRIG